MSGDRYILNAKGEPERCESLLEWGAWFERADRHVAVTELPGGGRVSTVFLGLDHGWDGGPPVLWETMVFGLGDQEISRRYRSRHDAEVGHEQLVATLAKPPRRRAS